MQRDERDAPTWVVLELTRAGERLIEEGRLEHVLRQHLRCSAEHQIFIPTVVYNADDPNERIVLSATEGYAFIAAGISESLLFRLEDLPFVKKVMSTRDPSTGMRVCMSVTDKDLQQIRDQLSKLISSTLLPEMDVTITHGHLAGMQGKILTEDPASDSVDVYIELRSLRLIRRVAKSAVRPLKAKR
jgi:hypothetical protein